MIYAHAAYGFGAVYLEHGLFYLIRIYLKHLWSRQRTLNTLNETMTIKGDTSWSDRTVYLIEFIKKSKLGRDVEILYVNWENDVIKQPFFIGSGSKLIHRVINIIDNFWHSSSAIPQCIPSKRKTGVKTVWSFQFVEQCHAMILSLI